MAVVAGTPTEKVLADALTRLQLSGEDGAGEELCRRRAGGPRPQGERILRRPLDPARRREAQPSFSDLKVIDRRFTLGPVAIALPLGNEQARLALDGP